MVSASAMPAQLVRAQVAQRRSRRAAPAGRGPPRRTRAASVRRGPRTSRAARAPASATSRIRRRAPPRCPVCSPMRTRTAPTSPQRSSCSARCASSAAASASPASSNAAQNPSPRTWNTWPRCAPIAPCSSALWRDQRILHRLGMLLEEARRPFDVREEEGDGAAGQGIHGKSSLPLLRARARRACAARRARYTMRVPSRYRTRDALSLLDVMPIARPARVSDHCPHLLERAMSFEQRLACAAAAKRCRACAAASRRKACACGRTARSRPRRIRRRSARRSPIRTSPPTSASRSSSSSPACTRTREACLEELTEIHQVVYRAIGDEMLWCASMPCGLPADDAIPIGRYGTLQRRPREDACTAWACRIATAGACRRSPASTTTSRCPSRCRTTRTSR